MRFKELKYYNFRNIDNSSINTDCRNVILEGINGQGKTNILESVYLLSYGSSFRTGNSKEIITFNKDRVHIVGIAVSDDGLERKVEYVNQGGKRRILLDGKEIRDRKELIYNFPSIFFSHDDINFVKGEPEYRRRFFDQTFSMYNPVYLDSLRRYKTILMQRNAAVKTGDKSLISLYDNRLATYGIEIMKARAEAVYGFNSIFPSLFRKVSKLDMDLEIRYQPSWSGLNSVDEITEYLSQNIDRDIILKTTTSGIHRDRFTVMSPLGPFSSIGSTGQIRLCSIIFRIAESEYFRKMTGKEPILLIDDVLLELDDEKRAAILSDLGSYSQAFYTFLPRESYFGSNADAMYYEVKEGDISEGRRTDR